MGPRMPRIFEPGRAFHTGLCPAMVRDLTTLSERGHSPYLVDVRTLRQELLVEAAGPLAEGDRLVRRWRWWSIAAGLRTIPQKQS